MSSDFSLTTSRRTTFALVGQPNCGKTTLFNALTGSHSRTANYPGATVEFSIGTLRELWDWPDAGRTLQAAACEGDESPARAGTEGPPDGDGGPAASAGPESHGAPEVVDLPGVGSLVPRSPDEEVAVRSLYGQAEHAAPDLAICVVDCSQLSRHLYLARQVQSTGLPVVVAVTMSDLLLKRGLSLSPEDLERELGCPVAVVDGRSGAGVKRLVARARGILSAATADLEGTTGSVRPGLVEERTARELARGEPSAGGSTRSPGPLRPLRPPTAEQVKAAYKEVEAIERACVRKSSGAPSAGPLRLPLAVHDTDPTTQRIDRVLLHPVLGLACFALLMGLLFTGVFWLAQTPMDAIDAACGWLADRVVAASPGNFICNLLGDGIIRGAGVVLVFLPQIVILFLGLGLLEDSGYLARAAVLVDRPLALLGLNGRAFVPLLSGFACAIPGILAARTIPNRRERLLTIFIMPLMSCSARLPVYALLLAFLTPRDKPWLGGLGLTALYLLSIAGGIAAAGLMSRLVPGTGRSAFMLELPVYRMPQLTVILRTTYQRSKVYLTKAGVPILALSTLLWLLSHLPAIPTQGLEAVEAQSRQLEASYAARAGRLLEPLMQPMGLDWRVGVSLIAAFTAREIFVGSLAIIFHVAGEGDAVQDSLLGALRKATLPDGSPLFTTASSLGLIVFFVFAMQCMSTAAVARKEAGSWWMPAAQTVAFTGFAYAAACATVTGLRLLGVG